MQLDARKTAILRTVVEEHIKTGLPVGSRTVVRKYRLGLSPATVRNEMADLEEMGYLVQPHTSAGRIPSDRGYRVYVDELMEETKLSQEETRWIEEQLRSRVRDIVSLIRETARVVSEATNYLSLVLGPQLDSTSCQSVHLLRVGPERALVVITTETGFVESRLVDIPPMTDEDMNAFSHILTRNLAGCKMADLPDRLASMKDEVSRYGQVITTLMDFLTNALGEREERLYMGGQANILNQPEFRDSRKAGEVFSALENEEVIDKLFDIPAESPVSVLIGEENPLYGVKDCSLVRGTFRLGSALGKIGVLGPKRMDYARAVAIVKFVEEKISDFFGGRSGW